MNTLYCSDCGSKNQYEGARPKFCSACGEPFEKSASKLVKRAIPTKTDADEESEETVEAQKASFDEGSMKAAGDKMMTIGSIREEGGREFQRDDTQENLAARKDAQKGLLGT